MRINTPDENKAIRSLMTKLRNRARNDGRDASQFPLFIIGQTTTADYVKAFPVESYKGATRHVPVDYVCPNWDRTPTHYGPGPEVTAMVIEDHSSLDAFAAAAVSRLTRAD